MNQGLAVGWGHAGKDAVTPDEVRHVTDTCRRLAALIGMQEELDRNYAASREG